MADWVQLDEWRQRRLQPYLDRGLIDGYQPDTADAAFFVRDQLLVAAPDVAVLGSAIDSFGGVPAADNGIGFPPAPATDGSSGARAGTTSEPPSLRVFTTFQFPAGTDIVGLTRQLRETQRRADGTPVAVGPNHVAVSFQHRIGWPDGDPSRTGRAAPSITGADRSLGRGVRVAVIDTGFPEGRVPTCDWFTTGVEWTARPGESPHVDAVDAFTGGHPGGDGKLDAEAGHGVFVGGLIRRVAPGAELSFIRVLDSWGMGTEAGVTNGILQAQARGVDIVNLSLGFYALDNVANSVMVTAIRQLAASRPGLAVVAAAGNEGVVAPAFPAAFKDVISVGALDASGKLLRDTSNRGWWVDTYAPGSDLESAYVNGIEDPLLTLDGVAETFVDELASWSGTSFAAAMVTGAIAAELSRQRASGCALTPLIDKLAASAIGQKLGLVVRHPTAASVAHALVSTAPRAPGQSGTTLPSISFAL